MLVELGILAIILFAYFKCTKISPRIVCSVVQSFKQRNQGNGLDLTNGSSKRKRANYKKKKEKTKEDEKGMTAHKNYCIRNSTGEKEKNSKIKVTLSKPGNTTTEKPVPPINLDKFDGEARKRAIYSTEKATDSFSFTVDQYGGVVKTPFCQIFFPYGAVLRSIMINVEPKYPWKNEKEDNGKTFMTPEIFFTSSDEMKFHRPVELQMHTQYSSARKKEPIAVEIERTEHCTPPNWVKIQEVKFHKGMIKFFCNQFCGLRAVCNSSQRQAASSRVNYSLSVQDSLNLPTWKKMIYLRVFSDTPDTREQIQQEMELDGYRRIHPTQYYTLKHGYNLIVKINSKGLDTSPPFEIVTMNADIISEAFKFTLCTPDKTPMTAPSLSVKAKLAEISVFKTSNVHYEINPPMREPPPQVNQIIVNNGIGMQNNFGMTPTAQENATEQPSVPPMRSTPIAQPSSIFAQEQEPAGATAQHDLSTQPESAFQQPSLPIHNQISSCQFRSIDVHPPLERKERVFTVDEVEETKPMKTWSLQHQQVTTDTRPNLVNPIPTSPMISQAENVEPVYSSTASGPESPFPQIPQPIPYDQYFPDIATNQIIQNQFDVQSDNIHAQSRHSLHASSNMPRAQSQLEMHILRFGQSLPLFPPSNAFNLRPITNLSSQLDKSLTQTPDLDPNHHNTRTVDQQEHPIQPKQTKPNSLLHKRHSSLINLEQNSRTSPIRRQRSVSISEEETELDEGQSHPTYTQTIQRSAFKSAFSSYPHVLRNLWDNQHKLTLEENKNEEVQNVSKEKYNLAMLEEDNGMLQPESSNGGYCDELFEAFANSSTSPFNEESVKNQENSGESVSAESQSSDLLYERPSAISSGFCSGISTRSTSTTGDAIFAPIEKYQDNKESPEDEIPIITRPRSMTDPSKPDKVPQRTTDSTSATIHQKSYSEVVKLHTTKQDSTAQRKPVKQSTGTRPKNLSQRKYKRTTLVKSRIPQRKTQT